MRFFLTGSTFSSSFTPPSSAFFFRLRFLGASTGSAAAALPFL